MFTDADHWLAQCEQCLISKGDYNEPKTVQGSRVANQPLELLCIDFTKADVAKGGKESILVLTDAFSKYSQAFVTNNQKSLTMANGSVCSEFLLGSIVIKVGLSTMKSFLISARCMVSGRVLPHHTIPTVIHNVNGLIEPCSVL